MCFTWPGLLLLIAVIIYGAKYFGVLEDMESQGDEQTEAIFQLFKKDTKLGYSFGLEAFSAILFLIGCMVTGVYACRGNPNNMAV